MAGPIELVETKPSVAKVIVKSLPNKPGIAAELFSHLGSAGFNVEMITESGISGDLADISFAITESQAEKAVEHLIKVSGFKTDDYVIEKGLGILTVYGKNLARQPGIAGKVFSLLAQEAINIEMISTSLTGISVLIKDSYLGPAKNLISKELGVGG